MRVQKKHVGRPLDFRGGDGYGVINGVVEKVQRGFVTVRYWAATRDDGHVAYSAEGFTAILPVRSPRIVEVY